jgi:hypothetical protein
MNLSRRVRPVLPVITVAAVVAACFGLPAPSAQAFLPQNHELITRNGLPPAEVDQTAYVQIFVGPPLGAGVAGSEAFQLPEFRHFDNAKDPADVCARAQDAWNFFIPMILGGAQPVGPGGTELADGPAARGPIGGLVHSVQDFYSHSNWVELNIAAGQPERPAPKLYPTCDPAALPVGLYSGYFDLAFLPEGCPPGGPPPGFAECHETLNKDDATTPSGSVRVPGTNMNQFDLAILLAARATTEVYQQVRSLVASNYGECAAGNLFQADLHQACGDGDGL